MTLKWLTFGLKNRHDMMEDELKDEIYDTNLAQFLNPVE